MVTVSKKSLTAALALTLVGGCAPLLLSALPQGHKASQCVNDLVKKTDYSHSPTYKKYYDFYSKGINRGIKSGSMKPPILAKSSNPATPAEQQLLLPAMVCFSDETGPEVMAAFVNAMQNAAQGAWPGGGNNGNNPDYFITSRWSGTAGTPRNLMWSFIPDGVNIPDGIGEGAANNNLFAQMDAKFAAQGGRATWIARFTACFARWEQLTGLSYTRVTFGGNDWDDGAAFGAAGLAGARGDVRICGKTIDGVNGVLAYNFFPSDGDMVIDTADNWGSSTNFNRFLRDVVMHEHGHGTGVMHVCSNNAAFLMEPFVNTAFDGPQQDDIRANQRHYGDDYESNDTSGTASSLGALTVPQNVQYGSTPADATYPTMPIPANASQMSIRGNGDFDYYSFTVPAGTKVTATATPVGSSYDDNAQAGDGSCPSGSTTNALAADQLSIALYAANGTTQLATADAPAAGSAATTNTDYAAAGTYFVRVTEVGSPLQSQCYKLTLQTAVSNQPPVLNPIGNKSGNEGAFLTFTATASDPDAGQLLHYSISGGPSGSFINTNTGAFSWGINENDAPGTYTVTVTVTDNGSPALSDSETITLTANEVNVAPSLSGVPANNTVVNDGQTLSFTAVGSDTDIPAQTLTYSLPTAPLGATINPTTGVFSWTPTQAQFEANHTLSVRVTDAAGATATTTINLITQITTKTVKFDVSLDAWPMSRNSDHSLTAYIRNVGSPTDLQSIVVADPEEDGSFTGTVSGLYTGNYDVVIDGSQWLSDLQSNINFPTFGTAVGGTFALLSGDPIDDEIVQTDDYLALSFAFDTTPSDGAWNKDVDFNGDEIINTDDYLILSGNFDLTGDL